MLTSILVASCLLILAAGLLWPQHGLLWRWRRLSRSGARVLLEDGLKHLYDCEYHGRNASVDSLAGALELSLHRATESLIRMEALGLVVSSGEGVALTPAGRDEALRIVRVHRLWERYLAETTGISRSRWHREAERREHDLSPEEVDSLSRRLGHPAFDPHGDPIPTADGDMPPQKGMPLSSLQEGEVARIEHVEDEPETTYTELSALGLHPGAVVQITRTSAEEVSLLVDGRTRSLAPVLTRGIRVHPAHEDQIMPGPYDTLDDVALGERVRVARIDPSCQGLERRRLMDLGLVRGTVVEVDMKGALGGPTAYVVRGATIALRSSQAHHIHVERELAIADADPAPLQGADR